MASGLLALLDDMVVLLDDVAAMSKVAVKKTTGVVGDDLAVSAHQVTGSASDRELPIVWAVTKGSLKNKLIIVPLALLLSAFLPAAIPFILLCGGVFLCYEGMEKVFHSMSKHKENKTEQKKLIKAAESPVSLLDLERQKIKGAIKTDFVLSIEIVFIALGTMIDQSINYQIVVLSFVAFLITLGVYGLVALIVRMDDVGLALTNRTESWR
jgi:predicted DNA repair protein MutK